MHETEILGMIEKDFYEKKVNELTIKYGNPTIKKRLSIMLFDRTNPDIDTRIRITNGQAEFMQKEKIAQDAINTTTKIERQIDLPSDAHKIVELYRSLENLLKNHDQDKLVKLLVQTNNLIWRLENVELKLSHQYGRSDFYTFEIELTGEGKSISEWQKELELVSIADLDSPEYSTYQSDHVDLLINDLSEEEFLKVVESSFK